MWVIVFIVNNTCAYFFILEIGTIGIFCAFVLGDIIGISSKKGSEMRTSKFSIIIEQDGELNKVLSNEY